MPLTRQQKKDLNIIDLEAYTIASEETIDAKLEAFENRMEDKMRSLFTKFSIGRPSSPRKSQHGETLDRQDDPQEHGHITSREMLFSGLVGLSTPMEDSLGSDSTKDYWTTSNQPISTTSMGNLQIFVKPPQYKNTKRTGDSGRSKDATTVHSYGDDFLYAYSRITFEPRGMKDKGRSQTSHVEAYSPLCCHPSPCTKKIDEG
ncbi:hypothetical protein BHE74_00016812 [Ensete ventricosum]|nr:hypothetical protein BHE74_00016812 [Ensete ventricosum]